MSGGARNQTIRVFMDTSSADASSQRFNTAEAKRTRERATNDQKAAQDSENAYVKAIYKMMAASKQLADQKERDRKKDLSEQKAADDAYVRGIRRRVNAENRIAQESAAFRTKTDREAATASVAANKEVDALFAWGMRDRTATLKREMTDQARTAANVRKAEMSQMAAAHKLAMMNWGFQQQAMKEQEVAANATKGAVLGYVGAFVGIGAVVMAVQAIASHWDAIRRDTIDAVKEALHFREVVMELAAMKGELGKTGPEVGRQMTIVAQTAQREDDALRMSKQSEGAAQAAIDHNLTREAYNVGFIEAAKLQAMEGPGSGGAYGDLYGTLALEAEKGTTGPQMAARFNKEFRIQQPGKFASMGEYAKQRQELSGYVQSGMLTAEDTAALLAGASLASNPQEAATHLRQGMSSLSADPIRARKMKMSAEDQETQQTSSDYFQKKLKIDLKHTGTMGRLDAVLKDLQDEEKGAIGRGETWDAHGYMIRHGINNREAREFYMDQASLRREKSDKWSEIDARRKEALDPNAITDQHKEFLAESEIARDRKAQASKKVATFKRSLSTEGTIRSLRAAAFEELKGDKLVTGEFTDFEKDPILGRGFWDTLGGGYYKQADIRMQSRLYGVAKKHGLDWGEMPTRTDAKTGATTTEYIGDEAIAERVRELAARKIDPMETVSQDTKKVIDLMQQQNDHLAEMKELLKGRNGAPPGAPARRGNGAPLKLAPKALDGLRQAAGAF
jgi:hypothetical protein